DIGMPHVRHRPRDHLIRDRVDAERQTVTQNLAEPLTVHRLSTPRWDRERANFALLTIKETELQRLFRARLSGALVRARSWPLSARCRNRTVAGRLNADGRLFPGRRSVR